MGWQKSGGKWWYKYSNGSYPKNKWAKISGSWYHFDKSGYMQTGWLKDAGKWYYLGKSGAMQTGWQKISSKYYYFASSGVMQTGWFEQKDKNGKLQKYWLDSKNGDMFANGVKQISGKWYAFDKDGHMTAALSDTAGRNATNLKIDRDGYNYKGSWKLPSEATNSSSNYVYASEQVIWELLNSGAAITRTAGQAVATTENTVNANSFAATSPKQTFGRADFYPLKNRFLNGIKLSVVGAGKYVKTATQAVAYNFTLPRKPTISWEYDATNGKVTATIKTDAGADNAERYDTMYMAEVRLKDGKTQSLTPWKSSTSTSIVLTYDTATFIQNLAIGQYVTFTAYAYARGFKGDNPAKAQAVKASRTLAIPTAASIKSVTPSSKDQSGRVAVEIQVGANTDNIKLQRRNGESGGWTDVEGAQDNAAAKTLYDSVGLADPQPGEYVYYRVVSTKDNFTTTGAPFRAEKLYTAPATTASTSCEIVSLEMDEDGQGAKMVFGYTESQTGGSTEVSWSTDPNAWESNQEPEVYQFSWKDKTKQSDDWQNTTTLYIRGLEAGETYYFKARRVYEGDTITYSEYASRTNITPVLDMAESVSLVAPPSVVRGEPITAYWEYQGDVTQRSFFIHPEGEPNISLAQGMDSLSSANIAPERYGDADVISFYVSVGAGSELTDSNVVTVEIIDPPSCSVYCEETCKAQPFAFEVYTDTFGSRLGYTVKAHGIVEDRPDKVRRQLHGDVIVTSMITPTWIETAWSGTAIYTQLEDAADAAAQDTATAESQLNGLNEGDEGYEEALAAYESAAGLLSDLEAQLDTMVGNVYMAQVSLPNCDLVDTGKYWLEVFTANIADNISSQTATADFTVAWEHQAPIPPLELELTVDEVSRSVTIALETPEGAQEGDVYDLYRGSAAGYDLIKSSLELDDVITDRWAAFGEQHYRVCSRTPDGDIAFNEYPYSLIADVMRLDWLDGFSETSHSLNFGDTYTKDFERRSHIGSEKGAGYWNGSYSRTGSYTTATIKDLEDANLLELGRYSGAVFCRTPEGHAFQCNADVSRANQHSSMTDSYSLSITEVELTNDFKPSDDDIEGAVE